MEQRKHPRYRVEYAGSFSGDKIRAQAVVLDLSSVGCKARSPVAVQKGDFLGALIDVPRYPTPLQVALAVVRWSQGQEFGMEFIRMAPECVERRRATKKDGDDLFHEACASFRLDGLREATHDEREMQRARVS